MRFHNIVRVAPGDIDHGASGIPQALICLVALLVTVGYPPVDQTTTAHPLSPPPEIIEKAGQAVAGIICDALGLSDHEKFLSDDYWPINLSGNGTVMAA